jgi:5-methylcytosine-specific restriction endonuclease McrA
MRGTEPSVGADHVAKETRISDATRQAVLDRDNCQCQKCGTSGENRLQLHHVEFRSQGGGHSEDNLIVLCFKCHELLHRGVFHVVTHKINGVLRVFCTREFYR